MFKRTQAIVAATASIIIVATLISIAFFSNQTTPVGTPPLYQIVDGNFTIEANSYKTYNFTTPTDISKSQVSGSFNVYGSNASTIRVYTGTTPPSQTGKKDRLPNPHWGEL
jgi:hypothetical protein